MKIKKRQSLKRKIAEGSLRNYTCILQYDSGYITHMDVFEKSSGSKIILDRDDVAQACVTYIEKKLKPLPTK